jgi:Lipocalin-like domain
MSESIASRLVGTWKLVSYVDEEDAGYPFGRNPEGLLIYTPEGLMSVQLMKPGRALFQSHDWHAGTPEEYQLAGSGYIAYCGLYEVDEEKAIVTHVPSVALLPNLIAGRQVRQATLIGDMLTLRTVGAHAASRLEWRRVK